MRQLKYLPWIPLVQVALLASVIGFAIDFLLIPAAENSPFLRQVLRLLLGPYLAVFVWVAAAVGVGALAVYFLEKLHPQLLLNASVLWALVLCLLIGMGVRSLLPWPGVLTPPSYTYLVGVVLGVFLKGRPYWRR